MSFLFNFRKKKKILPDVAIFEVTFRCPYRCAFCYCPWENATAGEYPRSELSTQELKDALKMLKSCGVGQVTFSGGEPTSRSDFREILLYTRRELKLKVGIISNGYLIDEDFLDFIRPMNILLSLSVQGIKTYQQTTGVDGIDHVLELFRQAKARKIRTCANITVSKTNLPELYENIAYPLINGANYVLINRFMPGGRGMSHQDLLLNGEELNDLFDTVIDNAATRWLLISAGAILLFFVLFLLWKYQPGLFGRNKKLSPLDYEVSEDTIYGIDFDREIGQAERRGDYRQAVRMVYLQTLAALSESHKLDWQPQKTPSEYIREVRSNSFTQMSNSFIRVRYGNFEATRELLEQMRQWQRQQTEGGGHE